MQYLVGVDHHSRQTHLTRSDCVGFEVLYIHCSGWRWVSVRKMRALTVKMETETLIG